jgi:hypothetical protein
MPLTFGVFLATDLVLYRASHYTPNYTFYLCLLFSLVLGRALLVRSQNPARIAGGALGGYAFFFLVSNFAAWLEPAREYYRPHTFSTLMQAYWEGLVFLRMQPGHLVGDFVLSFGLFGMHALLAKAYFPAEEITLESAQ